MISLTVAGHVGNDPEVKRVGDKGTPLLKFSVASNSRKKDGPTTWVRVSLFGDRAETLAPMIHKGDRIVVSGNGELRTWKGDNGDRTDLELDNNVDVHLVEKKDDSKSAGPQQQQQQRQQTNGGGQQQAARPRRF